MSEPIEESEVEPELIAAIHRASDGLTEAACSKVTDDARSVFESHQNLYAIVLNSEFNCAVQVSDTLSHFQLGINLGFARFLNEMTKMLFSRINVMSESQYRSGQVQAREPVSFEETIRVARILLEAFWNVELPEHNVLPESVLHADTAMLYRLFVVQGLRFSIGHELGHVIMDVSSTNSDDRRIGEAIAARLLEQLPDATLTTDAKREFIRNWGCEFAADRLGLDLAMTAEPEPSFKHFQRYSAEWFFVMCDMLWKYYSKTRGRIRLATHPPPYLRLDYLRELGGAAARERDMTTGLRTLVNRILEVVNP